MPKKFVEDTARDPEDAWIFDSLVGFLKGPVWHVPVMSFIEQKSLSKLDFRPLESTIESTFDLVLVVASNTALVCTCAYFFA